MEEVGEELVVELEEEDIVVRSEERVVAYRDRVTGGEVKHRRRSAAFDLQKFFSFYFHLHLHLSHTRVVPHGPHATPLLPRFLFGGREILNCAIFLLSERTQLLPTF